MKNTCLRKIDIRTFLVISVGAGTGVFCYSCGSSNNNSNNNDLAARHHFSLLALLFSKLMETLNAGVSGLIKICGV